MCFDELMWLKNMGPEFTVCLDWDVGTIGRNKALIDKWVAKL